MDFEKYKLIAQNNVKMKKIINKTIKNNYKF